MNHLVPEVGADYLAGWLIAAAWGIGRQPRRALVPLPAVSWPAWLQETG